MTWNNLKPVQSSSLTSQDIRDNFNALETIISAGHDFSTGEHKAQESFTVKQLTVGDTTSTSGGLDVTIQYINEWFNSTTRLKVVDNAIDLLCGAAGVSANIQIRPGEINLNTLFGTTVNGGLVTDSLVVANSLTINSVELAASVNDLNQLIGISNNVQQQIESKLNHTSISGLDFISLLDGSISLQSSIYDTQSKIVVGSKGLLDISATDKITLTALAVELPAGTTIGNVSATELNYLDGVTSNLQAQLNYKASVENPTFMGTVTSSSLNASAGTVSARWLVVGANGSATFNGPATFAHSATFNSGLATAGINSTGPISSDADIMAASAAFSTTLAAGSWIGTMQYKLFALNTPPASATATGTLGEIKITSDFIYVCTATNAWKRSALTTW